MEETQKMRIVRDFEGLFCDTKAGHYDTKCCWVNLGGLPYSKSLRGCWYACRTLLAKVLGQTVHLFRRVLRGREQGMGKRCGNAYHFAEFYDGIA